MEARPDRVADFLSAYGESGSWSQLFRRAEGYIETSLLPDAENANRFLVIDRWRGLGSFESFKQRHESAYNELDLQCEQLTGVETKIGVFTSKV
jgi:heme-degrading monooxygenase HmoA